MRRARGTRNLRDTHGAVFGGVVQDNLTCVKRGYSEMQEIPQDLIHAPSGNGHA